MKNLKFLMFLLIGMISLTAFAIPKEFEKTKQKTEFVKTDFVNIQNVVIFNHFNFCKDDVPKEIVENLTNIVLTFEKTGKVPECNECRARCQIISRVTEGDCIVYGFRCDSGYSYWAVYTNGSVHVTSMYESNGNTTYIHPHYPCQ